MMVPFTREGTSEKEGAFFFHVVIGTNVLGEFKAVSGFGRSVNTAEILEGGRNHGPRTKWSPHGRHPDCTLISGSTSTGSMFDWIASVDAGRDFRRVVTIVQLTRSRVPLRFFLLFGAFPVAWSGPSLDADASGNDEESVTLNYDSITVVTDPAVMVMDVIPTTKADAADQPDLKDLILVRDAVAVKLHYERGKGSPNKGKHKIEKEKGIVSGVGGRKLNYVTDQQAGTGTTKLNNDKDAPRLGQKQRLTRYTKAPARKSKAPRGLYSQTGIHSSPKKHKRINFKYQRRVDWKAISLSNGNFVPNTPIVPVVLSNGVFLSSLWSHDDE
jgi:phage tail-like protein